MATDYSAYTIAQLETAYGQNATYLRDKSTSQCAEFIAIAEILILKLMSTTKGSGSVSLATNIQMIQQSKEYAQKWLQAWDDDYHFTEVTLPDLGDFR